MKQLRYPFSALFGDYLRGLSGLAISLVIVVTYNFENRLVWLFVGLTLLFLVFTIRTVLRQSTVVGLDEAGLTVSQWGKRGQRIDWDRLGQLSLRYYAPRKMKKKGFGSLLGRMGRGMDSRGVGTRGTTEAEQSGDEGQLPGDGWMELTLRAAGPSVTLDSALPDFAAIAQRAGQAARINGIELDPVTDDNLAALASIDAAAQVAQSPLSGPGLSGSGLS